MSSLGNKANNPRLQNPPVVRLPPRSTLDVALARSSQIAVVLLGCVAAIVALWAGRYLFAPIGFALVVGLMLGPVATFLEKRGAPPGLSAFAGVLVFLLACGAIVLALATPLSTWLSRLPQIWGELRLQLAQLQEPIAALKQLREQVKSITGEGAMTVSLEGSAMESVALMAPAILGQVLIFIASLYFFLATRHVTRDTILRLCFDRRLRWRVAHIFRDVERLVSRYLLSITIINTGLGVAVALGMYAVGVPSPILWGLLAALLNFVIYIGPAIMAVILLGVGLVTFDAFSGSIVPPLVYLAINAVEAQFVTPTVVGRAMTLNPFVVFLALAFWLWLWGPIGGFVAIPALLVAQAIVTNVVPGTGWMVSAQRRSVWHRPDSVTASTDRGVR